MTDIIKKNIDPTSLKLGEVNPDLDGINWEIAAKIFAPEKENWEKKLKKGIEKYPLTKDLLMILAVGGAVSLAVGRKELNLIKDWSV